MARFEPFPFDWDDTPEPAAAVRAVPPPVGDAAKTPSAGLAAAGRTTAGGEFWLDGNVLACACPECAAPMSVRLWLMAADCWQCGISIALSAAQQAAAERVLAQANATTAKPAPKKVPTSKATPPLLDKPAVPPTPATKPAPSGGTAGLSSSAPPVVPAKRPRSIAAPPVQPRVAPRRSVWAWLALAPAWLVSMILHMLLLLLLSLINLSPEPHRPQITLLTTIAPQTIVGGDPRPSQPEQEVTFDLPLDPPGEARPPQEVLRAQSDAKQLEPSPDVLQKLPKLEDVRMRLTSDKAEARMLAARDPRLRPLLVKQEGGTVWTEAAVARGLYWLAQHQRDDGSWSLDRFHEGGECRGRCSDRGTYRGRIAGTSLALLPFLGAGQTPHLPCKYRDVVHRGLRWLVEHQDRKTGEFRADDNRDKGMYVHGQATIVLCETLALTGDAKLREPAQRAVDFITAAQHRDGGWRYAPNEPGDTSVLGWQLMALHSARSAGLVVPEATLRLAENFLDRAEVAGQPGRYCYFPYGDRPTDRRATPPMTAEGLLCRFYLGARHDDPRMRQGVYYLVEEHLPDVDDLNFYYLYYATQTLHHWGGDAWEKWNLRMRDTLVAAQETTGHAAGSWSLPTRRHDAWLRRHDYAGGRLYMTSLAICTLEVYYRHAPLFRRIDLTANP